MLPIPVPSADMTELLAGADDTAELVPDSVPSPIDHQALDQPA